MSGLYQRTSQSLQGLTDVVITNIQNGQAPVYDATSKVYKNQNVLTPSSLPSGSSGDVIISDGAGGIFSTTGLNVNPSNGNITGTFLNVEDTIVKIANNAGSGAGGDTISIGWNSGTSAGSDAVAIGTNAGQGGGNNSISLGKNAQATYNGSIVINSLGTTTTSQEENACYINPLRNVNNIATLTTTNVVQYNDTTKELIKTEDLYTRHIKNTDLQNDGTLTNVGTATLYNGQLTVGVTANKIINGSNTLVVDFATNKVGVNQLTPAEELDVNGNIKLNGKIEVSNGVGSIGQVLSSNGASAVSWTNDLDQMRTTTTFNINSPLQLGGSYGTGTGGQAVLASNASLTHPSWINIYDLLYPVNSVKIMYGVWGGFTGQTWVEFGQGRTLVGLDSGDVDFDTIGETGGAKTHTLIVNEMPSHTHTQNAHSHAQTKPTARGGSTGVPTGVDELGINLTSSPASTQNATATNQNTGGNQPHNNLQPYIVVRYYRRTA